MFKLPFSILPLQTLRAYSHFFYGICQPLHFLFPFLKVNLKQAEIEIEPREYISLCLTSTLTTFIFFEIMVLSFLLITRIGYYSIATLILLFFSFFIFIQQIMYPKLIANRRIKNIEKNLLDATENILVQLNSGIPLFDIIVSIANGDYGEVSKEFFKAVKEINAGKDQISVLEETAATNPSLYFRRTVWQIVNGMKAGADMSSIMGEIINSLSEEQIIQIQRYGNQLNPLAMFYMLIAVIVPALGMTFLIIISSFIALSASATRMVFWGLYAFVVFFQIMFLGIIRSRRPNLLGEE